MSGERKAPRWADPFLLALMRTGEVREAAKWAGVDFTTAYARRKRHRDFAGQWDDALALFRARRAEAEDAEVRRIEAEGEPASRDALGTNGLGGMAPPRSAAPSPASAAGGTGLQVRRAHSARWTEAKERRFFDELVASAWSQRRRNTADLARRA